MQIPVCLFVFSLFISFTNIPDCTWTTHSDELPSRIHHTWLKLEIFARQAWKTSTHTRTHTRALTNETHRKTNEAHKSFFCPRHNTHNLIIVYILWLVFSGRSKMEVTPTLIFWTHTCQKSASVSRFSSIFISFCYFAYHHTFNIIERRFNRDVILFRTRERGNANSVNK